MIKKLALMLSVVLSVSCFQANATEFVEFRKSSKGRSSDHRKNEERRNNQDNNNDFNDSEDTQDNLSQGSGEDADIVKVVEKRRGADFVEGRGMVVTKLLPDDNSGLKHQKWVVRLSNGSLMQAVYNLDMCERVDLEVGDVIAMGGEFIWTGQGPMLHWLHFDPRQKRSDGYVEVNGKVYCGDGERRR